MARSSFPSFAGGFISGAIVTGCTLAVLTPARADVVTEDDPRWDCTTMGNQVCGPDNAQGAHPGQYVYGNLVVSWPVTRKCDPIEATGHLLCTTVPALSMDGDW